MQKKFQLLLISLLFFSLLYINSDRILASNNDSTKILNNSHVSSKLDSLTKETNEIKKISRDNFNNLKQALTKKSLFDNPIIALTLSLIVGIIASVITLVVDRMISEQKLRNKFKTLEGKYIHIRNDEIVKDAQSEIIYRKSGKISVETDTKYGAWMGRILMDKDMPNFGAGTFKYKNKDESGIMHIIVRDENNIYVFPSTLTHLQQKVHFYIMRRDSNIKTT